jgi:N-acetyl-gamma-glutamyl-phosphate reductase
MNDVDIVILGAAGFGGGELLRLLANHPHARSIRPLSRRFGGQPVHVVHPHLRGVLDIDFHESVDWSWWGSDHPVVFSAMPSFELAKQYATLEKDWRDSDLLDRLLLIDLSGDFRLRTPAEFEAHYRAPHPCPDALGTFTYGLPECWPEKIKNAKRIANPGCFATAIDLALLPLADLSNLGRVCISAMTGSSGSGTNPKETTHHPTRANDFRAYKPLAHQHLGEIESLLDAHGARAELALVPHSAPFVRGIFATLQFDLNELGIGADEFEQRYRDFCGRHPFVDLVEGSPRIAAVAGTNRCEIAFHSNGRHAVVLSAVDNLGKGMAGQAVQNMNIVGGWPEKTGLQFAAAYP